jgi:hypothetical protein
MMNSRDIRVDLLLTEKIKDLKYLLGRIFEPKRIQEVGNGENYVMRCFIVCSVHLVLLNEGSYDK